MPPNYVGQRLSFEGALCTVRYIGLVIGTQKEWLGVEWDDTSRGKHDGEHKGTRYFSCRSKSRTSASFIRPSRTPDTTRSFVEAVRLKYATETVDRRDALAADLQTEIEISGKTVYEVGFDKIRSQLKQLNELKIVLVDMMRIDSATKDDHKIEDICPSIVELDVSRNLFKDCGDVVDLARPLANLKSLTLNGNRLAISDDKLRAIKAEDAFMGVSNLSLDEMLVTWDDVCTFCSYFASLSTLTASRNELSSLQSLPYLTSSLSSLTSLALEYNDFESLQELIVLAELPQLQKLYLKGNRISTIASVDGLSPKFGQQLIEVDISYNAVASWSFVDGLNDAFPGLTSLRLSNNPIYVAPPTPGAGAVSSDETYMLTLARLANLTTLNFSTITSADRTNAEMFYLSRIGKAIAAFPEGQEALVIKQHPRYQELCEKYDEPVIVREATVNPNFLEARLIKFTFCYNHKDKQEIEEKIQEIPKGYDVYQIKGIVGKLFKISPLRIKLIWETGEWDPVEGYEDYEDSDTDGEEEATVAIANTSSSTLEGKFVKREVELEDSTRQIGNTVDAKEARVRIITT